MKRVLILCFLLSLSESSAFSATTFFPPLQPMQQNNSIQDYGSNIASLSDPFVRRTTTNYPDISRIEQSLYGNSFDNQNISMRLSRIEKSLFTTTYPTAPETQRIDNIISNFNQINKYPNISQNVLSRMESKVFKQSFPQNNTQRRVERLEQQIFGAVQSGDISSRYEALKIAINSYNKNPINNDDAYSSNNLAQGGWRGIAGNLGSAILGGSMTGFTPQINPYSPNYGNYSTYASPYGGGHGIYRGYGQTNGLGGYRFHNQYNDFGTGTGVTILD